MFLSLEDIADKVKFGRNQLQGAHPALCVCPHCQTHNVMPINKNSLYVECMTCKKWVKL